MTEAERRAASEPVQDALNDVDAIVRRLQHLMTTPGAVADQAQDPALAFLEALQAAQRAGLMAVRDLRSESGALTDASS